MPEDSGRTEVTAPADVTDGRGDLVGLHICLDKVVDALGRVHSLSFGLDGWTIHYTPSRTYGLFLHSFIWFRSGLSRKQLKLFLLSLVFCFPKYQLSSILLKR